MNDIDRIPTDIDIHKSPPYEFPRKSLMSESASSGSLEYHGSLTVKKEQSLQNKSRASMSQMPAIPLQ